MKKLIFLVVVSIFTSAIFAQEIELTDAELTTKLDSVLNEGNLLCKNEKITNFDSIFLLSIDTIFVDVKGEMTNALKYRDQLYVLFEQKVLKYTKLGHIMRYHTIEISNSRGIAVLFCLNGLLFLTAIKQLLL